jgi:23S rRNA (guanosine2251-2'-O)-methyltransferase
VIIYGRNPVHEALRGRRAHHVSEVWATESAAKELWLAGLKARVCSADDIARRCGSEAHQGICAEAGGYPYIGPDELLAVESPLIVALDQVQDPQNLGSICRTAECAGATGVVIPERRSAEVTPAVCKASAGAVEHLCIARVRNVADFLVEASRAGCWSYGASAPAGPEAHGAGDDRRGSSPGRGVEQASRSHDGKSPVAYTAPDYRGGVVLVLGSEGSGLRPRVAASCDELVSLPMRGRIESLGVAAAAAALLYGILQSREIVLDKAP